MISDHTDTSPPASDTGVSFPDYRELNLLLSLRPPYTRPLDDIGMPHNITEVSDGSFMCNYEKSKKLHLAAVKGDLTLVRELICSGAEVTQVNEGSNAKLLEDADKTQQLIGQIPLETVGEANIRCTHRFSLNRLVEALSGYYSQSSTDGEALLASDTLDGSLFTSPAVNLPHQK